MFSGRDAFLYLHLPNNPCALCPVGKELESQVPCGNSEFVVQSSDFIWSPQTTYRISYKGRRVVDVIWIIYLIICQVLWPNALDCKENWHSSSGLGWLWHCVFNAWRQHYRCSLANEFLQVLVDWVWHLLTSQCQDFQSPGGVWFA